MKRKIMLLAHNIRSLWNVGSLFRTCDAFAIEKLILSGYCAAPPRREISKTALGAENSVPWQYIPKAEKAIAALKKKGYVIVALEQARGAIELSQFQPPAKACLIVGHEVLGVPAEILKLCDAVTHIPMHGKKESLNVAVAAGIALHHLRSAAMR